MSRRGCTSASARCTPSRARRRLVILVPGASREQSGGSRVWASGAPNILNVAATRAKEGLIIVGRFDAWHNAGQFRTAQAMLPVVPLGGQNAERGGIGG